MERDFHNKERELAELRKELNDVKSRNNQLEDEMQRKTLEERWVTPGSSRVSTPRKGSDSEDDSEASVTKVSEHLSVELDVSSSLPPHTVTAGGNTTDEER